MVLGLWITCIAFWGVTRVQQGMAIVGVMSCILIELLEHEAWKAQQTAPPLYADLLERHVTYSCTRLRVFGKYIDGFDRAMTLLQPLKAPVFWKPGRPPET